MSGKGCHMRAVTKQSAFGQLAVIAVAISWLYSGLLCFAQLQSATNVDATATQQTQAAPWAAGGELLVLNKQEATLAFVDAATLKVVARVGVGDGPHEVVASADGRRAYVSNYGQQTPGNSISIIDLAARRELKRLDLGPLLRPHGIVERDGKIYFTAELNRVVARYDPAADKVDWLVGTGQRIGHMLVFHPRKKIIYTANILNDTVSVVELDQPEQPGPPPRITHLTVGRQPEGIDVSPDGAELWVGSNQDGTITVIDTATSKVKETFKVGGPPIRVKFTPDGRRALVSDPEAGQLVVFDAATRKELKRLTVGEAAVGILVEPGGKRAYVATIATGRVHAVNLEDLTVAGSVETGKGPDGLGWAGR